MASPWNQSSGSDKAAARLERDHVRKMIDARAATPPPALCDEVRNQSCKTAGLTPGVVIAAPSLTTTMTARVNKIRRRSSGILTVFKKAETID